MGNSICKAGSIQNDTSSFIACSTSMSQDDMDACEDAIQENLDTPVGKFAIATIGVDEHSPVFGVAQAPEEGGHGNNALSQITSSKNHEMQAHAEHINQEQKSENSESTTSPPSVDASKCEPKEEEHDQNKEGFVSKKEAEQRKKTSVEGVEAPSAFEASPPDRLTTPKVPTRRESSGGGTKLEFTHPQGDAEKIKLALKLACKKHSMLCCIVWTESASASGILIPSKHLSYAGTAPEYYNESMKIRIKSGTGMVGKAFSTRAKQFLPNVNYVEDTTFPRKQTAVKYNVRSVFALYQNNVVYEFDTAKELWKVPFEDIDFDALYAEAQATQKKIMLEKPRRKSSELSMTKDVPSGAALEGLCEEHGLCCCVVWRVNGGNVVPDAVNSYSGTAPDFVEQSLKHSFSPGEGLVGRVWESKKFEHHINVQMLPKGHYIRMPIAKKNNIRTTFAIYKGERVYEFSTPAELTHCPFESL